MTNCGVSAHGYLDKKNMNQHTLPPFYVHPLVVVVVVYCRNVERGVERGVQKVVGHAHVVV